jgi:hypothetical protein
MIPYKSTKKERIENERKASTYFQMARADADLDLGGRFKTLHTTTIQGSTPSSDYPRQPAGSAWAENDVPPEPLIDGTGEGNVLGYRIDGQPSTPSAHGIEGEGGELSNPPKLPTSFRRRV